MNKQSAEKLALELMEQHGLKNWHFKFDRAVRRFGQMVYLKRTISLSLPLTELADEAEVRDTILHEIAHALTPFSYHDRKWRATAIAIGCNGKRCYSTTDEKRPPKKYKTICPNCSKETFKYKKGNLTACGACCRKYNFGKYDPKYILKFIKI